MQNLTKWIINPNKMGVLLRCILALTCSRHLWPHLLRNSLQRIIVLSCCCGALHLQAAPSQYDLQYQKWRAQHQLPQKTSADAHYLGKPSTLPPAQSISINQANVQQLQQLEGVGAKKAQDIIEYRQKNGPFKSIEALQNVKGIGPKLIEKNRKRMAL